MGLFPQMHCAFLNVHNDVKQCSGRSSSVHLPPAAGYKLAIPVTNWVIVQELCESRGGRPGLSVLTRLLASVDVKIY